jgi:hypothetical protein
VSISEPGLTSPVQFICSDTKTKQEMMNLPKPKKKHYFSKCIYHLQHLTSEKWGLWFKYKMFPQKAHRVLKAWFQAGGTTEK